MSVLFVVFYHQKPLVMILGFLMGAMVVALHKTNIVRLIQKNERKTNLFGKGRKE